MTDQNFNASANFSPLIGAINSASDAWARYALEQNSSVTATKKYIKEIEEASKKLNDSVGRAGNTLNKFADAQNRVNASVAGFNGNNIQNQLQNISAKAKTAGAEIDGFSKFVNRAASVTVGTLLARSIGAVIGQTQEATKTMIDFQKEVSLIRSISQASQVDFDVLSDGLKRVSSEFNIPLLDAAQAAYLAVSNQVTQGAESLQFLTTAARLARVANSSLTESVNAISSVLKSYNLDATEAERVSAILFRTADLGRVSLKAIASQLGTVTILASQLAIPIEEVGAALATFTVRGVTEANALTFLRNIMLKILQPTEAMKEAVSKLGFESAEAAVKALGLFKFMEQLLSVTNGTNEEIADLFNSIRALQPALLFASDGAADFNKNLEALKNSTDGFNKAVNIATESAGFKLDKFFNSIKTGMAGAVESVVNGGFTIAKVLDEAFGSKNTTKQFNEFDKESERLKKTISDVEEKFKDVAKASTLAGAEFRKQFGSDEVQKQLIKDAIALDKLNRAQDDLINKRINESNRFIKRTEEGINNLSRKLQKLAEEEADNFSDSLAGQDKIDNIRKQIERVISERNRLVEGAKATGDTSLVVGSFDAERNKIKDLIKFYQDEFKDSKVGKESVSALQVSLSLLARQERDTISQLQKQLQREAEAGIKKRGELERQIIAQNAIAKSKAEFDIKKVAASTDPEAIKAEFALRTQAFEQNAANLNAENFKQEQEIIIKQAEFISKRLLQIKLDTAEQEKKIALEALQAEQKELEKALKRGIENREFAAKKIRELLEISRLLGPAGVPLAREAANIGETVRNTPLDSPRLEALVNKFIDALRQSQPSIRAKTDEALLGVPANFVSRINDPNSPAFINQTQAEAQLKSITGFLDTFGDAVKIQEEVVKDVNQAITEAKRNFVSTAVNDRFLRGTSTVQLSNIQSGLLGNIGNITPVGSDPNQTVAGGIVAVEEATAKQEVNIWSSAVDLMTRAWQDSLSHIPNLNFSDAAARKAAEEAAKKAADAKQKYADQSAADTANKAFNFFQNPQRRKKGDVLETKEDFDKRTENMREFGQGIIRAADAVDQFAGIMKSATATTRQKVGGVLQLVGGILSAIPTPYTQVAGGVLQAGGGLLASRNFYNGGLVYRSAGGDLGQASRSTDTVHAGLTPGEFVMNRMATDKFYPQLRAMNSFKGYASGGRVSNSTVNVGDINLQAPIANGQIDTVRLGNRLRNDIRNGKLGNLG